MARVKRRPGGDLIAFCSSLSRGGTGLCSPATDERLEGHRAAQGRVGLAVREHFCTGRVGWHWNRFPGEVLGGPVPVGAREVFGQRPRVR